MSADKSLKSDSKKKHVFHFTIAFDIALLKEVYNIQPFTTAYGKTKTAWTTVLENIVKALQLNPDDISPTTAPGRFTALLESFKKSDMESLQASGTEDDYTE
ncbi:hypothetical protein HK096_011558 [Nowakowskiella sp. JEL0078]|nr:hypothetical protein HK096_011558 [Nowakowskiella sp. JEL0078]